MNDYLYPHPRQSRPFEIRSNKFAGVDHTGLVVDDFLVEKRAESYGRGARWLARHVCGEAKVINASAISDAKRGNARLVCEFCESDKAVTFRTEATLEQFGLYAPAMHLLIAIMARVRVDGVGCTRKELREFGVEDTVACQLIRGRWATAAGKVLTPTDKAWRELGFTKERIGT